MTASIEAALQAFADGDGPGKVRGLSNMIQQTETSELMAAIDEAASISA
ncbi:hypothetical protein [Bradyrhizobium sp. RDT46]